MPNGAKHWCFTEFDTCELNFEYIKSIDNEFLSFQLEQCPETSKLHFQGFISFAKRTTLNKAKKLLPQAHWEIARNIEKAILYSQKEDSRMAGPWIFGIRPVIGERLDLIDARKRIRGYERWGDILNDEQLIPVVTKYHRWARDVFRHKPMVGKIPTLDKQWQHEIIDIIKGEPDPRKIIWVWSEEGGTGKSTIARFLALEHGALVVTRGASDDIIYAYDNQNIVVFDYPRSTNPDFIHWNLFEELKNGITFSKKYESQQKIFHAPHVIIFSNIDPFNYQSKLSEDRWEIKKVR